MDGVSGAASVIALIEISAKVVLLCSQYGTAVKNAGTDIQRLQDKVEDIGMTLNELKRTVRTWERPDRSRLSATSELTESLQRCQESLQDLKTQLDPGKTQKAMSRVGLRALKWPFRSKYVERVLADLKKYQQVFCLSLQIDNTDLVLGIDQKLDLGKLSIASQASYDSHAEEHNGSCLAHTRIEILRQIEDWVKRRDDKFIFWLSGMAGTGKSTIARTVAHPFAAQHQLGASFFFKRGEGDRRNASRFFTTIATDLMTHVPEMKTWIREAIDLEPNIAEKTLKDQFDKLVCQPLSKVKRTSGTDRDLVVVVDALDEISAS